MNISKLVQKAMTLEGVNTKEIADIIGECLEEQCSEHDAFVRLYDHVYGDTLCRDMCEHWVENMHGSKVEKHGQKFDLNQCEEAAKRIGINFNEVEFTKYEFYAVTNAMYYDFGDVMIHGGITPDELNCGKFAKAFIEDDDAKPGKVKNYYFHLVHGD